MGEPFFGQETTDLLGKFCEYSGLFINVDKTKSMAVDKSCSQQPITKASTLNIKVYGEEVEQVSLSILERLSVLMDA